MKDADCVPDGEISEAEEFDIKAAPAHRRRARLSDGAATAGEIDLKTKMGSGKGSGNGHSSDGGNDHSSIIDSSSGASNKPQQAAMEMLQSQGFKSMCGGTQQSVTISALNSTERGSSAELRRGREAVR